ncbi:MAG: uncharacterized protein K0Q68_2190 [Moraxellaceae bacterium]|jgi:hypothetical protein|nr:uncharacterized protein [Moraxellaceae bacterium]
MRALALAVVAAALAACAGGPPATGLPAVAYSAEQIIETTPGPFRNRLYVDADRERQDASLGGGTVTTVIRRDRGVAWLLVPGRPQYEEVPLEAAASASVEARLAGLARRDVGAAVIDDLPARHYSWHAADGRLAAYSWVTADGITRRAELLADPATGAPAAVIRLQDVRLGPQDPALFELPPGYQRRP